MTDVEKSRTRPEQARQTREDRLSEALKANLRRRKAQARARQEGTSPGDRPVGTGEADKI